MWDREENAQKPLSTILTKKEEETMKMHRHLLVLGSFLLCLICIRAPSLPFREKTSSAASKICRSVSGGVESAPVEGTEVVVSEVIAQTV